MSKKFEPCPRCGKEVELFSVRSNTERVRRFFKCPNCGLRTSDMYNSVDEISTSWINFVSASTCTYKKTSSFGNSWECSLCHWSWEYPASSSPVKNDERFCCICGARIQDYLDENGKSIKDGQTA